MSWLHFACLALLLLLVAQRRRQGLGLLPWLAPGLLCALLWGLWALADHFTGEGINDATLFHVLHGWQGISWRMFPRESALAGLGLLALVGAGAAGWRRWRRQAPPPPLSRRQRHAHRAALVLGWLAVGLHPAWWEAHAAWQTQTQQQAWASLVGAQVAPAAQGPLPHPPRSLVYIYAESLEQRFLDPQLFPGLTPGLQELAAHALSFRGIHQAPMTDWTIAGMVASQCGVPMSMFRTPAPGTAPAAQPTSSWAAGRQCLGDWLHEAGYRLVYMGGANPSFAGKGSFYQAHRFDEVLGRDELAAQLPPPVAMSEWGIYDDQLFQLALQKYRRLVQGPQPFALVLLTLDTHPPSGHATPACQKGPGAPGTDPAMEVPPHSMLAAVHCSDRLISQFVRQLEAEPGGQDVLVVVGSDHLQMRSDISERLQASGEREDLFMVRGGGVSPGVIRREASTMDIAPTLLSLLGWDVPAWGLGRNLLQPAPTLPEAYGANVFRREPPQASLRARR